MVLRIRVARWVGAVGAVEQGPVTAVGDHRLDALHEPGHDVAAVLFLRTRGIDHPFS